MPDSMFSSQELASLREAFALFDKDGDGGITQPEMVAVMRDFGQALDDFVMRPLFADADENSDGVLCFDEFSQFVSQLDPARDDHRAVHESLAIFLRIRAAPKSGGR